MTVRRVRRSGHKPKDRGRASAWTGAESILLHRAIERAWLIMALIGIALSDHPIIRSNKRYRHYTDQARKALFDLHQELDHVLDEKHKLSQIVPGSDNTAELEDDFGARFLRLKGSVPEDVPLDFDDTKSELSDRRRSRRKRRR
jgi:hypothetical protein